jgi:hypothetical protein
MGSLFARTVGTDIQRRSFCLRQNSTHQKTMKFGEAKLQRIFSEGKNAKETNHEQNDYNKQKNKYPPPPNFS